MDKCWFVLPNNALQVSYPPPKTTLLDDGRECQTGALCLGDLIPDLKRRDYRINQNNPEPYPLDMDVYRTTSGRLQWRPGKEGTHEVAGSFEAPALVAAIGVEIGAELSLAMRKSLDRYWDIESSEVMIIQPNESYISHVLAREDVSTWVANHSTLGSWKAFMITGLFIAKGKTSIEEKGQRGPSISAGGNVGLPEIAKIGASYTDSNSKTTSVSREDVSEFVWAVRLTKLSKGVFEKTWKPETYSKGATFGTGREIANVEKLVEDEGFSAAEIIHTSNSGVFVVIKEDGK